MLCSEVTRSQTYQFLTETNKLDHDVLEQFSH